MFLSLIGFAFKVSAVPFHFWAPDTYEGAPTPVTAFLSVASKAGGFVALINIIYFGFYGSNGSGAHVWWGAVWVLAALSMTFGNLGALRQTNIVRMLAYSSIAQGGFMLVPFVAAGIAGAEGKIGVAAESMSAVVIYLLIYGAMNLGAFAVVIAVAAPHEERGDLVVLGLVRDLSGPGGHDDALHGVARGHPAPCRLVRQVRDVPLDHRCRDRLGDRARRHRGGQLGGRVLLLLRGRAPDVVRGAGRGRPHRHPGSAGTGRRDRDDGHRRRGDRHLPAAVRGIGERAF